MHLTLSDILLLLVLSVNVKCDFSEDDIDEIVYLDTTVNPCDDFYQYTCGNFQNIYARPANLNVVDHFTLLQDELIQIGQEILSYPALAEDPTSLKKVKLAYLGCVNDLSEFAPELETITEFGGFPLIDPESNQTFSWNEIGDLAAKYGVSLIFSFSVVQIEQTETVLYIGSDPLSNPSLFRPEYQNTNSYDNVLEESFKEMGKSRQKRSTQPAAFDVFLQTVSLYLRDQIGSNKTDAEILNGINEMASFMRQLYAGGVLDPPLTSSLVSNGNSVLLKNLQIWTNEQFDGNAPIIWIEYLRQIFQTTNVNITEDTKIYYYVGLETLLYGVLNLVKQADSNVVKNFALLRVFLFQAPDSGSVIRTAFENYYNAKGYALYERSEYCTRQLLDVVNGAALNYAVTYAYKQYLYNINKVAKAYDLFNNIASAFKNDVNSSFWMDQKSINAAVLKANNILTLLAYPDFVESANNLDSFYQNLPICGWNTYSNAKNIRAFRQAYQFNQLDNTARNFWGKSAFDPNAYYNRPNNKIVIPIAMLNPIFFYGDKPLLDYSRLGSVIGHEISHGFDSNGKNYDENGLLNEWWTPQTLAAFTERSNCFVNQYNQFYVPQVNTNVNGSLTINENIADAGGVRIAFNAFRTLAKAENITATGKYTLEQLFFIGYGTMWCGEESNNYLQTLVATSNTYPPKKFRVIGSLSNMKEFADAFQCPLGSTMNPEKKCILW